MASHLLPKPFETNLLLVFPPFHRFIVSMENIGIEYIAASARARGFDACVVNSGLHGLDVDDVNQIVGRSRFRVLGISTLHWTLAEGLKIAHAARKTHSGCHIILGGLEAALRAEQLIREYPFIDSVALGEGEPVIGDLLQAVSAGTGLEGIRGLAFRRGDAIVFTPPAVLIPSLDALPFPARDDMAAVLDAGAPVSMSSSRGCFGRCPFCSVRAFYELSSGPRWRGRSPASVLAEMREIYETHGARLFSFIDETVMGPGREGRERLLELAGLLRVSGLPIEFFMTVRAEQVEVKLFTELKKAGLRKVEIGIESMSPSQLKRYGKIAGVRDNRRALRIVEDLGIGAEPFMIPFDPEMTWTELRENVRFYRRRFHGHGAGYDVAPLTMGSYLYPYPGTGTRGIYEREGWLEPGFQGFFRSHQKGLDRVCETMLHFVAYVEPFFPMSFAGFGNLWTNSFDLPLPEYRKACRLSRKIGQVLVEVAEWAIRIPSKPLPLSIPGIEGILADLRSFIARLNRLRDESTAVAAHCRAIRPKAPTRRIRTYPFARDLHRFGRGRKRIRLEQMHRSVDENDFLTAVLNIVTREGPP